MSFTPRPDPAMSAWFAVPKSWGSRSGANGKSEIGKSMGKSTMVRPFGWKERCFPWIINASIIFKLSACQYASHLQLGRTVRHLFGREITSKRSAFIRYKTLPENHWLSGSVISIARRLTLGELGSSSCGLQAVLDGD